MKTTLKKVLEKALKDKNFLDALAKNPKKALQDERMVLSSKERIQLENIFLHHHYSGGPDVLGSFAAAYGQLEPPRFWKPASIFITIIPPTKRIKNPR